MDDKGQSLGKLGKSVLALISTDALSLVLMVALSIFLGRTLGEEKFGIFSLSFVITAIFRTLIEAGYDIYIPRVVAAEPGRLADLLIESQTVKNITWAITLPAAVITGLTLTGGIEFLPLTLWLQFASVTSTLKSALRGLMRMDIILKYETAGNVLLYSLCFLAVFYYPILWLLFMLYPIIEIIKILFLHYEISVRKKIHIPGILELFLFRFSKVSRVEGGNYFKKYYAQSGLTVINFLSSFQARISTMFLGWFSKPVFVGEFSAGLRFLTAMRIIPGAFLNTLLPELSSGRNKKNWAVLFVFPFIVGLLISFILWYFAEPLINFTFGFSNAVAPLKILAWTFVFTILNHTLEAKLLSVKMEKWINLGLTLSIALILVLCIMLIPAFNSSGAAWAAISGEAFLTVFYFLLFLMVKNKPSET